MSGVTFPVEELLLVLHFTFWHVTHWAGADPGAIAFLGALVDSVVERVRRGINGLGREAKEAWKVEKWARSDTNGIFRSLWRVWFET